MIERPFGGESFKTDEQNFRAKFIRAFALSVMLLLLLGILPNVGAAGVQNYTGPVLGTLIAMLAIALYVLHRGDIDTSAGIIVVFGWIGLAFQALVADGVHDVIVLAYIALGLFASVVLGWRVGALVIITSIAAIWLLALLQVNHNITPSYEDPIGYARDLSFIFIAIAVLVYFSTTSLTQAVQRAGQSEANLRVANQSLQELNQTLEARVTARTQALESANVASERRARQFEAVAQVARVISSGENLEPLLSTIAEVISEQFGHYHTGIFLLDPTGEHAIFRATNSAGGRKMLERQHRLPIASTSIVGHVISNGQARIALDVGADAAYFNNPDLPGTHSEIALPLRITGQVIGALDVQSEEQGAFQSDDIAALSTLADQVAIAIQNARALEDARKALAEAQSANEESAREAWTVMRPQSIGYGLRWEDSQVTTLTSPVDDADIHQAGEQASTSSESGRALAVPIRMRGRVIGVLNLNRKDQRSWTDDESDIAQAVADRLSLAIEAASLLRSAQHRADIERITTDITSKIGSSARFDTIMQTAAQELSRALGGSDVLVQIEPVALKMGLGES